MTIILSAPSAALNDDNCVVGAKGDLEETYSNSSSIVATFVLCVWRGGGGEHYSISGLLV